MTQDVQTADRASETLDLLVVDLTGQYDDRHFMWPMYVDAQIRTVDGAAREARSVAFSRAQIEAMRRAGDLGEITVEASLPSYSACWHVDQIFLPGTPIVPTKLSEADADGNVSHIRAHVEGGLQVQSFDADGDLHYDFTVRARRNGEILIDNDRCDSSVTIPAVSLDHMIEALTALRDQRDATA